MTTLSPVSFDPFRRFFPSQRRPEMSATRTQCFCNVTTKIRLPFLRYGEAFMNMHLVRLHTVEGCARESSLQVERACEPFSDTTVFDETEQASSG